LSEAKADYITEQVEPCPEEGEAVCCKACGYPVGRRVWVYDYRDGAAGMYRVLIEYGTGGRVFDLEKRLPCGHWFGYHAKHKRDRGAFE
jgi:hypothetical protein